MRLTARLDSDVEPKQLLAVVSDLATYPSWLDIVAQADPETTGLAAGEATWSVELRAQLGPIRRAKRLRMVRTDHHDSGARFERRELDGRQHSPWVLTVRVGATPAEPALPTRLDMTLEYGGSLWFSPLDRIVRDEIERSRPRLVEFARRNSHES